MLKKRGKFKGNIGLKTDEVNGKKDLNSRLFFDKKIKCFLTSKEAASYLRTSPQQLRNWVYLGKLRCYKLMGRKLLFNKTDLDSLLAVQGGF